MSDSLSATFTLLSGCVYRQSFVLSEMTEANLENNRYLSDWYGTSTFDAIGDIFLMISLWFFASVW